MEIAYRSSGHFPSKYTHSMQVVKVHKYATQKIEKFLMFRSSEDMDKNEEKLCLFAKYEKEIWREIK